MNNLQEENSLLRSQATFYEAKLGKLHEILSNLVTIIEDNGEIIRKFDKKAAEDYAQALYFVRRGE